jgi:cytochrome c553
MTSILLLSCSKQIFSSNGETICNAYKNQSGEKLHNKSNSPIKIVNSCKTCHEKKSGKDKEVTRRKIIYW